MTTRTSIICLLIGSGIISSCGTSKKLDAANSQISDLQSMNSALTAKNTELTSTVNSLNSQVADLSAQNKTVKDQFASYKKQ